MNLLGSFVIAFSMYSRIPMPHVLWTKERMKYALCFFPLIGVVIGTVITAVFYLLFRYDLGTSARSVAAVIPLIITGGIHMDGFLDVTDALSSHGERERKLEILKDPHTGAFAIIGMGVYLVLYLSAVGMISEAWIPGFCATFILTRALSAWSVVCFPKAKNSGLAAAFSDQSQKRVVQVTMIFYVAAVFTYLYRNYGGVGGSICVAGTILVFWYYYRLSMKEFGGITGDLAGYFLQVCELVLLCLMAVLSRFI